MDRRKAIYFLVGFWVLSQLSSSYFRHVDEVNKKCRETDISEYVSKYYPKPKEFEYGGYNPTNITLPNLYMQLVLAPQKARAEAEEKRLRLEALKAQLKVLNPNAMAQIKETDPIKNPEQQGKELGNWKSYAVKSWKKSNFENYSVKDKGAVSADDVSYYLYVLGSSDGLGDDNGKQIKVAIDKQGNFLASEERQTDGKFGYRLTIIRGAKGARVMTSLDEIGADKNRNFVLKSTYKLNNGITKVQTVTMENTDNLFDCLLSEDYCPYPIHHEYEYVKASAYFNLMNSYGVSKYCDSSGKQLPSVEFNDDKFKEYLESKVHPITRKLNAHTSSYLVPSSD